LSTIDVAYEVIDPVEGDPLYTFVYASDPSTGNLEDPDTWDPVTGASPQITCKVPAGTVISLIPTENPGGSGNYQASILTGTHGGGVYIFRWYFPGPTFYGAIEYKVKVNKSKVLN
jgi:hypothetical protein